MEVPFPVRLGCNTSVNVLEVVKVGAHAAILKFDRDVGVSSCSLPICIWTDLKNIPYKLSSLANPDVPGRTRQAASCNATNEALGCGEFYPYQSCKSENFELLEAKRFKKIADNKTIPIPYLVGVGVEQLICEDTYRVSFKKMSSIWNEGFKK